MGVAVVAVVAVSLFGRVAAAVALGCVFVGVGAQHAGCGRSDIRVQGRSDDRDEGLCSSARPLYREVQIHPTAGGVARHGSRDMVMCDPWTQHRCFT